jgi:hypothetical protein
VRASPGGDVSGHPSSTLACLGSDCRTTCDTPTPRWSKTPDTTKTLSERTGHAVASVTMKIYTHNPAGRDRDIAPAMGELIERAMVGKRRSAKDR